MIGYLIFNIFLGFLNFGLVIYSYEKKNYKSVIMSSMASGFCFGIMFMILITEN